MRISDWSSDVCSSDLIVFDNPRLEAQTIRAWRGCWPDEQIVVNRVYPRQPEAPPIDFLHRRPSFPWSQKKEEKRSFNGGRKAAKMGIDFAEVPVERHIHKRRRPRFGRSEEHTSELQSLMRISYAVFCLTKKHKQHSNQ